MSLKLTYLYMAVILIASTIPSGDYSSGFLSKIILDLNPKTQNLLHIPAYAILAALWYNVFTAQKSSLIKKILASAFITILYGGFNELIQLHVPGRYAEVMDLMYNCIGSVVGVILYFCYEKISMHFLNRYFKKKKDLLDNKNEIFKEI